MRFMLSVRPSVAPHISKIQNNNKYKKYKGTNTDTQKNKYKCENSDKEK